MGRWSDDDPPAPAGMQRIGYDTDTQRYRFRDSDGSVYEGSVAGGDLMLVSRAGERNKADDDDEPIRLMPGGPIRRTPEPSSPTSPTSPTSNVSFKDILPAHLIASAPPPEPPKRRVTVKAPTVSLQRSQTSPGRREGQQRSLWNVVRAKTVPTKMRGVVESVTRRDTAGREHASAGQYQRLEPDASEGAVTPATSRHVKTTTV